MAFNFGAVISIGEPMDTAFYPSVIDHKGAFARTQGEVDIVRFTARSLDVHRGEHSEALHDRLYQLSDADCQWTLTNHRLVMVCPKYEKGGGWIGTPVAWLLATVVSRVGAAIRTRGKCLAGQVRLRWIDRVMYQERHGRRRPGAIRIIYRDATEDGEPMSVIVTLRLPKNAGVRSLAQLIIDAAGAIHEAEADRLSEPERQSLKRDLTLPPFDPVLGEMVSVDIPGALPARADTTGQPVAR